MNPKLPLVEVVWKDAWVRAEESITLADVKASHKPAIVHTLGWLLLDDEEGVSLANEYFEDAYRGRTFIYRPMIISVTPFSLTKVRTKRAKKPAYPVDSATATAGPGPQSGSGSATS